MASALLDGVQTVARNKPDDSKPTEKDPIPQEERDRFDLRLDPALRARAKKAAKRLGMAVSPYIRMALVERLQQDEAKETDERSRN